jgi:hypothetical protein
MDEEPEPIPWSAPGLLWRIQERRRYRAQPKVRKTLRVRLAERGLHWNTTVVVGMFISVAVAAFAAVLLATHGSGGLPGDTGAHSGRGSGAGGWSGPPPPITPTPALCYVSEQERPCH